MIIPESSKYHSSWKFVEVANYVPSIPAVIRFCKRPEHEGGDKVPILFTWEDACSKFRDKHNNTGVYTSVFRYEGNPLETTRRFGSLYFDLDSEHDVQKAFDDVKKLHAYFTQFVSSEDMRLYFTGEKGFHLEIEALAMGISPAEDLDATYRFIAEYLKRKLDIQTFDMSVYDPRRMWRMPYSRHQKTGLYKIELPYKVLNDSIDKVFKIAQKPYVMKQRTPQFQMSANQWYKNFVALHDTKKERERERLEEKRKNLFAKYGTSLTKGHSEKYVQNMWKSVIQKMKDAKERNNTLSAQAFRVYLSYLKSSLDIDEATESLKSLGLEVGLAERETVATLNSALKAAEKKYAEDPINV